MVQLEQPCGLPSGHSPVERAFLLLHLWGVVLCPPCVPMLGAAHMRGPEAACASIESGGASVLQMPVLLVLAVVPQNLRLLGQFCGHVFRGV